MIIEILSPRLHLKRARPRVIYGNSALTYGLVKSLLSNKLKKQATCTECGSSNLLRDYETSELICQACGIVVTNTELDTGPEWRAFDQQQRDKLPRVGAPVTWKNIHEFDL